MKIQGIGIISSAGRGIENFVKALQQDHSEPKSSEYSAITKKTIPVFSVDDKVLKDKDVLKKCRRSDRFCKMAVLAAWDAFKDSGIEIAENEKVGVIVSTSFGPHRTTFNFLDNILDYGEASVSPTTFSHSVHNAAASYIASVLNIKGPAITLTDFCFPFCNALQLADAWINQGRCKYVLVGTVDELSLAMEYICTQKLNIVESIPGEGSAFFLLSDGKRKAKYCNIECNQVSGGKEDDEKNIVSFNNYSAWGWVASGSSFCCASAALMLKNKHVYSNLIKLRNDVNLESSDNIKNIRFFDRNKKTVFNLTI